MSLPEIPRSLWLDEYGPYTPSAALAEDLTVDVAIIGGGFTGLATAHRLRRKDAALRVAVLEQSVIGYGASGRNGSFAMTVIGLGFSTMALLRGEPFLKDAHPYMERAVDGLEELVRREGLDCELSRPGFLRMATAPAYVKRLEEELSLIERLGLRGFSWLSKDEAQAQVSSPLYLGALRENRLLLVQPLKLLREEKKLAERLGVRIFEHTNVTEIERGDKLVLRTPGGTVRCEKLVLATNAYSHLIPMVGRKQAPAWTYMVASEPLSPEQLASIGWRGRQGIEDARNLIHYYRLTPQNRLVMGGGPVGLRYGQDMDGDHSEPAWQHLESHVRELFPGLSKLRFSHRWGGAFSVTMDLTPALGFLGDERVVYSIGCIGHGVAMSHQNALTIADLLLGKRTANTECPFVNRRLWSWPNEPLRSLAARGIRTYLQLEDRFHERR